ncbi:hypothetical protein PHMEG_0008951, partial [Phytophthora megakarya]
LDISPHAAKLFNYEIKHISKLTVIPARVAVFYVLDAFDRRGVTSSPVMYETNMTSGTCRPCRVSQQFRIPCRHIQAVLFELERRNPGNLPGYRVLEYFHIGFVRPKICLLVLVSVCLLTMAAAKRRKFSQLLYTDRQEGPGKTEPLILGGSEENSKQRREIKFGTVSDSAPQPGT